MDTCSHRGVEHVCWGSQNGTRTSRRGGGWGPSHHKRSDRSKDGRRKRRRPLLLFFHLDIVVFVFHGFTWVSPLDRSVFFDDDPRRDCSQGEDGVAAECSLFSPLPPPASVGDPAWCSSTAGSFAWRGGRRRGSIHHMRGNLGQQTFPRVESSSSFRRRVLVTVVVVVWWWWRW